MTQPTQCKPGEITLTPSERARYVRATRKEMPNEKEQPDERTTSSPAFRSGVYACSPCHEHARYKGGRHQLILLQPDLSTHFC